jgi:APA family basic amino acid/polyamine antiporter
VEKAFGRKAAFFTAWTYWLISWVSSIAVIIAAVGYLSPLIGILNPAATLALEIGILAAITLVNMRGASFAGSCEIFLTLMKCTPLIIIPLVGLFFLKMEYFQFVQKGAVLPSLNTATLMTFWGFIGLETATTTAAMIENPTKTIPRAVIMGTFIVAVIYLLNSIGIMGLVPPETLTKTQAPYVEATRILFGGGWDIGIALIAFIACIGTLNAWVLTSGQIAVEAAKDGLFPSFFAKVNGSGAPYMSLLIAFGCTVPILCLTLTPNILTQLNAIIDVSVTTFVLIYLASSIAAIKILGKKPIVLLASGFCLWVLAFTSWQNLLLCSLFILSGVPVYLGQKRVQPAPLG